MTNYKADSIESLDYFEHIRRYPGMYIGSKDLRGLHHCLKEILSNSIDEYLNGAGSKIEIILLKNNGIQVIDNGRGIPHGTHPSGCSILQACFGIANTGGKFNNATGETGYNSSGGEHGTGGKAVNALSTKMIVSTSREGLKEIVEFSRGTFVSYNTEKTDLTGTSVTFYPDKEIFETIEFDIKLLKEMIQEFSYLCKGLTFVFKNENTGENQEFYSDNGLYDYIKYLNGKKNFLCEPYYINEEEGNYKVEVVIGYNDSYSSTAKLYTNNIPQEKGTHLTGFKTAWTSSLNKFARAKGWLKEKDENLSGSDLEEGQILILNFKMIDPVFKGQNKEELSSSEGRTYVQRLVSQGLEKIFMTNGKTLKHIIDKAINARKAREAAKKARENVRTKAEKKTVLAMPSKLADCNSSNRSACELFVTEGDSASGGAKTIRDAKHQAVLGLRGKVLNVLTADITKIHKNAEIMDIIKALGFSWSPDGKSVIYDKSKLRYGKFIIASDRDSDGSHIQLLILTCLWKLVPQLILDGYVYIALPPLYKAEWGTKYEYLQDKASLEEFKRKHTGAFTLTYFKGLGEADPKELGQMIIDPKTRLLQQVTVEDVDAANKIISDLMGKDSLPKKKFVFGTEIKEVM